MEVTPFLFGAARALVGIGGLMRRWTTAGLALALPPFAIPADQYADFEAFCSKVDEVERGQLRFTHAAPPSSP